MAEIQMEFIAYQEHIREIDMILKWRYILLGIIVLAIIILIIVLVKRDNGKLKIELLAQYSVEQDISEIFNNYSKPMVIFLKENNNKNYDDIRLSLHTLIKIDELEKRLKREALVMSRKMREDKEREFRIKANDFKMLQNKYRAELKELDFKIVKRMRQELLDIVEEMGKKEGYLLILEKREGGVLYYPTEIDITDTLVRKYNAKKAEKPN